MIPLVTLSLWLVTIVLVGIFVVLFCDLAAYLRMHESERWWFRTTKWGRRRMNLLVILAFIGGVGVVLGIIGGIIALAISIA